MEPQKTAVEVTPSSGKVLSKVTVAPIPNKYQDVSKVTAVEEHVLFGDVFVDSSGTPVTGKMPDNGATGGSIDGLAKTSVTIPAGYTTGGTVALTNDIENALAAI